MSQPHFITVEGPIGIGKTSLANAISEHYRFTLLKEIVEDNPFLGKFYQNIQEWSFQTEMFFLCNRYKQLQDISTEYLHKGIPAVSDYNVFKNVIFARRTLSSEQLDKYLKIYGILTEDMPKASLVVYLTASVDTIMNRIKKRGRSIEKDMDRTYIENLTADYENYMNHFMEDNPDIPVLRLDCDHIDFVHKEEDLVLMFTQINEKIKEIHYV